MLTIFQSPKLEELEKRCHTLERVASLLLEGIRLHSIPGEEDAYSKFRAAIERHGVEMEIAPVDGKLVVAGSVMQSMSEYTRRTTTYQSSERRALQGMVGLLTTAMAGTLVGQDRTIGALQTITAEIEKASRLDDLYALKGRLESCLVALREEKRKEAEEQGRLSGLMTEVSEQLAAAVSHSAQTVDPVTGLPNRVAAQNRLAEIFAEGRPCQVRLLRLENLVAINSRYGRTAGDDYFVKVARLAEENVTSGDRLFRWEGAVLMVLVERTQQAGESRTDLAKFVANVSRAPLMLEARSVMLRVSLSSLCLHRHQFQNIDDLYARINSFVYDTPVS